MLISLFTLISFHINIVGYPAVAVAAAIHVGMNVIVVSQSFERSTARVNHINSRGYTRLIDSSNQIAAHIKIETTTRNVQHQLATDKEVM